MTPRPRAIRTALLIALGILVPFWLVQRGGLPWGPADDGPGALRRSESPATIPADAPPALLGAVPAGSRSRGAGSEVAALPKDEAAYPAVTGVVVDVEGRPVVGAFVQAWSRVGQPPAVTDGEGRFALPGQERGYLHLRAWAKGLVSEDARAVGYAGDGNRLVLVSGRPARVTVLRASDRTPVSGARVLAMCGDQADTDEAIGREAHFTDEGRTGTDGVATLSVPEGPVQYFVLATGFASLATPTGYMPAEGAATEILVSAGGAVVGRVLDQEGSPIAGARVHVVCDSVVDFYATTPEDGSFAVHDVPPEGTGAMEFAVSVRADGWAPAALTAERPPADGERCVELRLRAGRTLEGVALDAERRPVVGASVRGEPGGDWFHVERLGESPHQATTDAHGRFRLEHVDAGKIRLSAYGEQSDYWAYGESVVPANGPVPVVELVEDRKTGAAAVSVRIVDAAGAPVKGAWVDAEDPTKEGRFAHLIRQGVDVEGRACFDGLPSAPVRLTVVSARFAEHAVTVDMADPPEGELEIRMPAGFVEGRVQFPDGTPARVEVILVSRPSWDPDGSWWPWVKTDASGAFRIDGLDDGVYSLRLQDRGTVLRTGPRSFRAGARPTWIVGRPTDPDWGVPPIQVEIVDDSTGSALKDWVDVEVDLGVVTLLECSDQNPALFVAEGPVEPGRYPVRIRRQGFLDLVVPDVEFGNAVPARISAKFDAGAVVEGRILAENDRLVERCELAYRGRVFDAPEGTFRIAGLPDGEIELKVSGAYVVATRAKVQAKRSEPTTCDIRVRAVGAILAATETVGESDVLVVHLRRPDGSQTQGAVNLMHAGPEEEGAGTRQVEQRITVWFPALEPGQYTLLVAWNGAASTSIPVDVKAIETTSVTLIP